MSIDGVWKAFYMAKHQEPFTDMGNPNECGIIVIQNGLVMGRDPWGIQYSGRYTLDSSKIHVLLDVSGYRVDAEPVIPGLVLPYRLDLKGEFNSPDYFSVVGEVIGAEGRNLVVNCKRIF